MLSFGIPFQTKKNAQSPIGFIAPSVDELKNNNKNKNKSNGTSNEVHGHLPNYVIDNDNEESTTSSPPRKRVASGFQHTINHSSAESMNKLILEKDDMIFFTDSDGKMHILTIISRIGQGAYGDVYQCSQKIGGNERKLALKVSKEFYYDMKQSSNYSNYPNYPIFFNPTVSAQESERVFNGEERMVTELYRQTKTETKTNQYFFPELLYSFRVRTDMITRKRPTYINNDYNTNNKQSSWSNSVSMMNADHQILPSYRCLVFQLYDMTLRRFQQQFITREHLNEKKLGESLTMANTKTTSEADSKKLQLPQSIHSTNSIHTTHSTVTTPSYKLIQSITRQLFEALKILASVNSKKKSNDSKDSKDSKDAENSKNDPKGIVHADLKPDNIMVTNRHSSGIKITLIDFGFAKTCRALRNEYLARSKNMCHQPHVMSFYYLMSRFKIEWTKTSDELKMYEKEMQQYSSNFLSSLFTGNNNKLTNNTRFVRKGCPYLQALYYRSPETILGGSITCATDCFSAGVFLWEMATGQFLFPGKSELDLLWKFVEVKGSLSLSLLLEADPSVLELFFNRVDVHEKVDSDSDSDSEKSTDKEKEKQAMSLPWFHLKTVNYRNNESLSQNYIPGSRNLQRELQTYVSWTATEQKNFIELIYGLLTLNPSDRWSADRALSSDFLKFVNL
jgi:serine/threonine protein kinase